MKVTIRQAHQDDQPAIETFLKESFGLLAPFKVGRRWRWQFMENPTHFTTGGYVPIWIALDGKKVVGQIAVQPTALKIGPAVHTAGWIVDVMILPAYRGRGLGHQLHDVVGSAVPVLLMLTMAPAMRCITKQWGAVDLGQAWQFSRWVHFRPDDVRRYLLRRLTYHPRLRDIVRIACDGFLMHRFLAILGNLATAIRRMGHRDHVIRREVVKIDRFGPEIDRMWQTIAPIYEALCVRNSGYLNWRYVDCPDLRYQCFAAKSGDAVVGYSVLRQTEPGELRLGVISDIFAAPDDKVTLASLLGHALSHFGADVASIECVTSMPELALLLRKSGFVPTRTTGATGAVADPELRAEFVRLRGRWFFTKGDHDWDQIQLA